MQWVFDGIYKVLLHQDVVWALARWFHLASLYNITHSCCRQFTKTTTQTNKSNQVCSIYSMGPHDWRQEEEDPPQNKICCCLVDLIYNFKCFICFIIHHIAPLSMTTMRCIWTHIYHPCWTPMVMNSTDGCWVSSVEYRVFKKGF